jgi:hypothetical protein
LGKEKMASHKKMKSRKEKNIKSSVDTFRNTFSNESYMKFPKSKNSKNWDERKLPPLEFGALTPTQGFFVQKKKEFDVLSEKDMQ